MSNEKARRLNKINNKNNKRLIMYFLGKDERELNELEIYGRELTKEYRNRVVSYTVNASGRVERGYEHERKHDLLRDLDALKEAEEIILLNASRSRKENTIAMNKRWDAKTTNEKLASSYLSMFCKSDIKYHLTLSFGKYTSKAKCENDLNMFLKFLNRKIYKNRYSAKLDSSTEETNFIRGFVVRENTIQLENDHFHIMILDDDYIPDFERFFELCGRQFSRIRNNFNVKGKTLSTLCLQEYYSTFRDSLENYLVKQFNKSGHASMNERHMGLLTDDKVNFIDLDYCKGDKFIKGFYRSLKLNKPSAPRYYRS